MAGKAVGADGNAWVVLPDNSVQDITVKAAGVKHYNAHATPTKYHPYITANTTNLDNATPEFCVGQQVNFVLNGLPGSINMVGNWTLPGAFVNESYADSSTCTSYDINNSLLQNTNTTSCWFINKPGGTVSVGMNLLFSNGQSASIAADGNISVYRPTVSFTPEPPFTPMVTNGLLQLGPYPGGTGVMKFEATVQSKYSGVVNWTQLINRYGEYGPLPFWYTTTHGDYWLDTSQFYGDDNGGDKGVGPTVNDPTIHFNDNPGWPCPESVDRRSVIV